MRHFALLVVAAALCAPMSVVAQERRVDDDDVVELDTTLVEVPVVVSEPGGRYVTDLKEPDFKIFENGVEQEVGFFAAVSEPINVALMLDTSGSTRDKLDRIKEAASVFLDQLRPQDRVSIVVFEEDVRVATPLTSDRARLRQALDSLTPGQYTQVFEAVHTVAEELFAGVEGRKAAILFTDGVDTSSAIATFDDSLDEIARRQVIVYPIRYNTRPDVEMRISRERRANDGRPSLEQAYHVADAYLYEIASRTGGRLHRADSLEDLPSAFAQIADELRHQYLLGYYPSDKDIDDADRRITVTVTRPGVTVRAREVYRALKRR